MSRRTTRSANDGGHGGIGQNGDKIPGNPQEPAKVPDRSESDGNRDSRGWFVKGCAPGPGRKPRRSVHEIASELAERDGVNLEDKVWAVVLELFERATKKGDVAAAKLILEHLCTKDAVAVQLTTEAAALTPPVGAAFSDWAKKFAGLVNGDGSG